MAKKMRGSRASTHAQQALSAANALEHRVAVLEDLNGVNGVVLDRSLTGLISLYNQTEYELTPEELRSVGILNDWAAILFAIDETFLGLAAKELYLSDSWRPLFEYTQRMLGGERVSRNYAPMRSALQRVRLGLDHLRRVSFAYCALTYGNDVASQMFLSGGPLPRRATLIERIVKNLLH